MEDIHTSIDTFPTMIFTDCGVGLAFVIPERTCFLVLRTVHGFLRHSMSILTVFPNIIHHSNVHMFLNKYLISVGLKTTLFVSEGKTAADCFSCKKKQINKNSSNGRTSFQVSSDSSNTRIFMQSRRLQ